MSLQLKGEQHLEKQRNTESISENNPWDYKTNVELDDEPYHIIQNSVTASIQGQEKQGNPLKDIITKLVTAFVVCLVLIFGGRYVVSSLMPDGRDITELLKKDANSIATELGVTFQDNSEWVSQIHQYSKGTTTVKAADGIGIVYIDGKQAGIHIRDKKYTIYGIQIGQGEKNAYDNTSYLYDNFLSILNDMAEGKTTTYFYYNNEHNDCVALTVNDTTNRIVGITYFYDFNKIMETIDRF